MAVTTERVEALGKAFGRALADAQRSSDTPGYRWVSDSDYELGLDGDWSYIELGEYIVAAVEAVDRPTLGQEGGGDEPAHHGD